MWTKIDSSVPMQTIPTYLGKRERRECGQATTSDFDGSVISKRKISQLVRPPKPKRLGGPDKNEKMKKLSKLSKFKIKWPKSGRKLKMGVGQVRPAKVAAPPPPNRTSGSASDFRNKCLSHELIRLNFSKTSLSQELSRLNYLKDETWFESRKFWVEHKSADLTLIWILTRNLLQKKNESFWSLPRVSLPLHQA